MRTPNILIIFSLFCLSNCIGNITIESSQPHNKKCYTQGIFFLNSTHLFESCGLHGKSFFHVMEYQSKPFEIRQSYSTIIPWKADVFLEGAVIFKNYIYMLTWQERKVFKLDPSDFSVVKELSWPKEGWGLATNGTHMFATDGSNNVYIVDENFNLLQTKSITDKNGYPQESINQLQFVDGHIYANIYMDTKIVKISLDQNKVVEEYDGFPAVRVETSLERGDVLNGIAYDKQAKKFIVTGKHFSKIHQVSFSSETLLTLCAFFISLMYVFSF